MMTGSLTCGHVSPLDGHVLKLNLEDFGVSKYPRIGWLIHMNHVNHIDTHIYKQYLQDGGFQLIRTLDIQFSSDFHGEDEEPTEDQVSPHLFFGGQQI